jgi:hypothetical protein
MKIRPFIPCGRTRHNEAFCSFANAPEKQTLLQNRVIIAVEIYRRSAVMLRRRDDKDHSL